MKIKRIWLTRRIVIFGLIGIFTLLSSCKKKNNTQNVFIQYAKETLEALYENYSIENTFLLSENYPFDKDYAANYLASEENSSTKPYSYLWPYSGTFSAVNSLYVASNKDERYYSILYNKVLPGLELYFDTTRTPFAYSSYVITAPLSDRFYDDNIWIGIDFTDLYQITSDDKYLAKAKLIWNFVESGYNNELSGGIYWCEQKKKSKNTCSNAPAAVFALKLFNVTKDSSFFYKGKMLYDWTQQHLQDSTDYLYFDNINLAGKIDTRKYSYNSGQMLQSAALLYKITKNDTYLIEAQKVAQSCYNYFFKEYNTGQNTNYKLLTDRNIWFVAVMLRGFVELYHADKNEEYLNAFRYNLEHAWQKCREENGLFNSDWSGQKKDDTKWLLTQAAMAEMYARSVSVALIKTE